MNFTHNYTIINIFFSDDKVIKYTSLVVLVLQNTSLVLFMRYAMTGDRPKFLKVCIFFITNINNNNVQLQTISVFYGEVFKLLASIVLVCCGERSLLRFVRFFCEINKVYKV